MKEYTAIYEEAWITGSHRYSLIKWRRIEQENKETIEDMLKREGIEDSTVYLFVGHPKFQGE